MQPTTATQDEPAAPGIGMTIPLWPHVRSRLLRAAVYMPLLCLTIALGLTLMEGRGFSIKLIYSFSIGLTCWILTEGVLLALAVGLQMARQRRGLALSPRPFSLGWAGTLPLIAAGALVGPSLGLTLADSLTGQRSPGLWNFGAATSRVTLMISLLATSAAVLMIWTQERMAQVRAQAEAARRAQVESQLRLLQSQLEPHMLFNTLANLRVLIGLDPSRAQAMLDRLIAFLRATLQASRATQHPLSAEFDRLADYLALMQVRMGPRLGVHFDLPAELRALAVPPLILQPLVENSIQHGLEPQVAGGRIEVTARAEDGRLHLSVKDDGMGLRAGGASPGSTGFGLEQIRSRLATLYGDAAQLTLLPAPDGRGTLARIELPCSDELGTTPDSPPA